MTMNPDYQKTHSRALVAAERTIDDLIGRWTDDGFTWPADVAAAAGVPAVRRRRTAATA